MLLCHYLCHSLVLLGSRGIEVIMASSFLLPGLSPPPPLAISAVPGFWSLPFDDWFRPAWLPVAWVFPLLLCLPALELSLDGLLSTPVDVALERFPTGLLLAPCRSWRASPRCLLAFLLGCSRAVLNGCCCCLLARPRAVPYLTVVGALSFWCLTFLAHLF